MYKIGRGKSEIHCNQEGLGMMGYGRDFNVVKGKATPLYSRSLCIEDTSTSLRVFFVNVEMCFITSHLKRTVVAKLNQINPGKYSGENILITAQHTHSAPGGYANYPLYNFSIPGFRQTIFDAYLNAIVDSILESQKNLESAKIKLGIGEFEPEMEVGFNRSLKAYNQNKDVEPLSPTHTYKAMDRKMKLLKFESESGEELGALSFFGVHTTSVGNRVLKICSDNKGYASQYMEDEMGGGFSAIFAQGIAGDISPNFHGKGKRWPKGKFKDDIKSAEFNGDLQFQKPKKFLEMLI
jgi:neutral ceramidase